MNFRFKREPERRERNVPLRPVPEHKKPELKKPPAINPDVVDVKKLNGDPLPSGESPVRMRSYYEWGEGRKVYDIVFDMTLKGFDLGNGLTALDIKLDYSYKHVAGGGDYGWRDYFRWNGRVVGTKHLSDAEKQAVKEYDFLRGGCFLKISDSYDTEELEQDLKDLFNKKATKVSYTITGHIHNILDSVGLRCYEGSDDGGEPIVPWELRDEWEGNHSVPDAVFTL